MLAVAEGGVIRAFDEHSRGCPLLASEKAVFRALTRGTQTHHLTVKAGEGL